MVIFATLDRVVRAVRTLTGVKREAIETAKANAEVAMHAAAEANRNASDALTTVKHLQSAIDELLIERGLQPKEWLK
jgi:uncharacterized iron-regulated protein